MCGVGGASGGAESTRVLKNEGMSTLVDSGGAESTRVLMLTSSPLGVRR
jgi:hypothetical protein